MHVSIKNVYLCTLKIKSKAIPYIGMGQLQEKYKHYREPQKFMEADVYPYFRAIEGKQGTEVEMGGHKVLMFGSNAYTGLTGDQRIIDAAKRALDKYGSGCAGSRFLNGTLDLHVQLEKEISEFIGKEDCLCFSTGFSVNQGVLAMVVGKDDYIICDDRDHASIVDGRRLSFARQLHYKHNDMEDLERVLKKLPHEAIKLIVVDGVFSMEGDLAKLPEIVELKHKYNCSIMVDEAHGIGVFGKQGRGVSSSWVPSLSRSPRLVVLSLLTGIPSISCVTRVVPISSQPLTRPQLQQQLWRPFTSSRRSPSVFRLCGMSLTTH